MTAQAPVLQNGERSRNLIAPLVAGIPILLVVLWGLGALREQDIPGLPVVPVATLWALPIDLWVRDIATALVVGFAVVGGVLAPRPDPRSGRNASLAALVLLAALVVQSIFTVSEVLALPVSESLNPTILWSLLTQTTLGRVIIIQFVVVALIALLAWVVLGRITGLIVATAAIVVTFLPGFTGHSGIDEGHSSATISLGVHVIAASVWIGGLVATVDYVRRSAPQAGLVLRRFSMIALVSVIVLVQSGLVNASLRLDGVAALLTSTYGAVILTKIAVLIVLIGFGWRQRRGLSKDYEAGATTKSVLLRLSGLELAWMGAAVGLAVALARTAPPGIPIASDFVSLAALGLLALAIPLAARFVVSPGRWPLGPRFLREYPESVAVALVATMFAVSTIGRAGTGNQQLVAVVLAGWLIGAGVVFWTAVNGQRSLFPIAIVAVSLPFLAWWNERDVDGGLGIGTGLVTIMLWGVLAIGVLCRNNSAIVESVGEAEAEAEVVA